MSAQHCITVHSIVGRPCLCLFQLSIISFTSECVSLLGVTCIDKHPEEPLHLHRTEVLLKEPWENWKSTRSAGSPQEETGMCLILDTNFDWSRIAELGLDRICFSEGPSMRDLVFFFHLSDFILFIVFLFV